eukprot:604395-Prymnesium_polylepis.1
MSIQTCSRLQVHGSKFRRTSLWCVLGPRHGSAAPRRLLGPRHGSRVLRRRDTCLGRGGHSRWTSTRTKAIPDESHQGGVDRRRLDWHVL